MKSMTSRSHLVSDRLGFDRLSYPKSFMSLMWMKDYTYMVINDEKVP